MSTTSVSVTIDAAAFTDIRFDMLAQQLVCTRWDVLGRMAVLWKHCLDRGDAYVSDAIVRCVLGPKGVAALVAADLAESFPECVRIKGLERKLDAQRIRHSRLRPAAVRKAEALREAYAGADLFTKSPKGEPEPN